MCRASLKINLHSFILLFYTMIYEMTQETMANVLKYLSTQPYNEVAKLIQKIQQEAQASETKQKKKDEKKKK